MVATWVIELLLWVWPPPTHSLFISLVDAYTSFECYQKEFQFSMTPLEVYHTGITEFCSYYLTVIPLWMTANDPLQDRYIILIVLIYTGTNPVCGTSMNCCYVWPPYRYVLPVLLIVAGTSCQNYLDEFLPWVLVFQKRKLVSNW